MQKKHIHVVMTAFAFAALLALTSCGYRLTPVGGVVPEGAKTIAIPVFINGTNEPFLDTELTQAVVDAFLYDGRLKVVSLEGADLVLRGQVTKFDVSPASYTANAYVQTYNVSIGVSMGLEDTKTKKALLTDSGVGSVFVSSYPVTLGDIPATKTAKETAIKNAARDIASTIRSRVLEGF
jgi:outer membrane lipopolysaccharide assembly protein LptE/RlpB